MTALPGANLNPISLNDQVELNVNVSLNHEAQPAVYLRFSGDVDFEAVKVALKNDVFFDGIRVSAHAGTLYIPVEPSSYDYLGLIVQRSCEHGGWHLKPENMAEIVGFASHHVRAARLAVERTQPFVIPVLG